MQFRSIEELVETKYPSRFRKGVRSVNTIGHFYEVMSNGGETLYLTRDYVKQQTNG